MDPMTIIVVAARQKKFVVGLPAVHVCVVAGAAGAMEFNRCQDFGQFDQTG